MGNNFEETDIVKILQVFGTFRNSLPKEHSDFVRAQLQKDYDTVTKTFVLGGKEYTGTFREDSRRKNNKEAYEKESKLAAVLASFGFDVILIEENNSLPGKKPDAIVNGIVMDFKEITAISEKDVTENTLGNNYQRGMKKEHTAGVALYLHNFSNVFVSKRMEGKTATHKNGLALFFHEDTGTFQLIDMQKIRAAHEKQALSGTTSRTSSEHHTPDGFSTSEETSSSYLQINNSTAKNKKSRKSKDDDFGIKR